MDNLRQRVLAPWAAAVLLLALQLVGGASPVIHRNQLEAPPVPSTNGTTAAAHFCGCCCSVEDEQKLRETFLAEVKAHGYHDAQCRSKLKAYICAVCLSSAPAVVEPSSNTTASITNISSLPLRCAAPGTPSISIHDLTSPSRTDEPETPEPDQWLSDDNKAPTTPKWLIPLIASVLSVLGVLFGGFVAYKICKSRLGCCNNNQCCSNITCWLCSR